MKLSIFVFTAIAVLTITAAAQGQTLGFYGGDVNPDDPNLYQFPNGNTLAQPDTHTYGCITIPHDRVFRSSGMMFNVTANVDDDPAKLFDPMVATYEVHRAIGTGVPGIILKVGTAPISVIPTGRTVNGETEYTVQLLFGGSKELPGGGPYCVNITPQCTNPNNPNCSIVSFYVDNTTQRTNDVNGQVEIFEGLWAKADVLGYNWVNWCATGLNAEQCGYMSFGAYKPQ
jgi:hypothetical protein